MNREQREFCEKKYARGGYEPSAKWKEYTRVWQDHGERCRKIDAENNMRFDQAVLGYGSGGGWDDARDRIPYPAPPILKKPELYVIEKFECLWLKWYHPGLLEYYTYHPGRAERFSRALLFLLVMAWQILCFVIGLAMLLGFIAGVILFFRELR